MSGAVPLPAVEERNAAQAIATEGEEEKQAIVPVPEARGTKPVKLASPLARISLELDVAVPIREFRIRDLIGLDRGQVIETQWNHGEDLPLAAGKVQLAWTEFDVIDTRLAVRITRLA